MLPSTKTIGNFVRGDYVATFTAYSNRMRTRTTNHNLLLSVLLAKVKLPETLPQKSKSKAFWMENCPGKSFPSRSTSCCWIATLSSCKLVILNWLEFVINTTVMGLVLVLGSVFMPFTLKGTCCPAPSMQMPLTATPRRAKPAGALFNVPSAGCLQLSVNTTGRISADHGIFLLQRLSLLGPF